MIKFTKRWTCLQLTVVHPPIREEKESDDEGGAAEKHEVLPAKLSHRKMDLHGVQQVGSSVYNINRNKENYLLGLANHSHSEKNRTILNAENSDLEKFCTAY